MLWIFKFALASSFLIYSTAVMLLSGVLQQTTQLQQQCQQLLAAAMSFIAAVAYGSHITITYGSNYVCTHRSNYLYSSYFLQQCLQQCSQPSAMTAMHMETMYTEIFTVVYYLQQQCLQLQCSGAHSNTIQGSNATSSSNIIIAVLLYTTLIFMATMPMAVIHRYTCKCYLAVFFTAAMFLTVVFTYNSSVTYSSMYIQLQCYFIATFTYSSHVPMAENNHSSNVAYRSNHFQQYCPCLKCPGAFGSLDMDSQTCIDITVPKAWCLLASLQVFEL